MNRYLIIGLYALSFTLLFQYFFINKPAEAPKTNDFYISIQKESVVIPNAPKIEINNHSATGAQIDTCRDIKISIDSRPLTELAS